MNPSIGTLWRFKELKDETPDEIASNRFVIVGHDGGFVEYTQYGKSIPTRRPAREFHKLFERILPSIE
jgi:hypothetical protein